MINRLQADYLRIYQKRFDSGDQFDFMWLKQFHKTEKVVHVNVGMKNSLFFI